MSRGRKDGATGRSRKGEPEPRMYGVELERAPSALRGKKSAEPEIVRWVARNLDNPDADPEDCPDPFAWTMLRALLDGDLDVGFFIEKLWSKLIPSRSQLESAVSDGDYDGKPTVDLIDRILAMKARSEAAVAKKKEPKKKKFGFDHETGEFVYEPTEEEP